MGHSHDHNHHHVEGQSSTNLKWAFVLNTVFAIVELAGGYLTNSVSLTSDALHDFGDSLSLGLSLYFHRKAAQRRDAKYTYGYRRFSLVGAICNSLVLITGSVLIVREAVERIADPVQPDAQGMLWLALIGIAVNGLVFFRLKKGITLNERAVALHFVEDVLGWVAVLAGALVMQFYDVPVLDPILSLLIACYILFNVYGNLKASIRIVLQGFPADVNQDRLKAVFSAEPQVLSIHDLHVWSLDGNYHVLSAHVVLSSDLPISAAEPLKQRLKHEIEHAGIHHCTLEFELSNVLCNSCDEASTIS